MKKPVRKEFMRKVIAALNERGDYNNLLKALEPIEVIARKHWWPSQKPINDFKKG